MNSLNKCKACEEYKRIIRERSAEIRSLKELNNYLESEIKRLEKQIIPNNKSKDFNSLHETNQRILIKNIQNDLSIPLIKYFKNFNLKAKLLTFKSNDNTHVIDFEHLFNKRNIGDIEVKKFKSIENMNESQEKSLSQTLSEVQNNNLSDNAYRALSFNNVNMNSFKQLNDMRKIIDSKVPIINVCDEKNEISGSYLEIDYAFKQSIKSLVKRKNKSYFDLKQP
jgi:hypothetical protein